MQWGCKTKCKIKCKIRCKITENKTNNKINMRKINEYETNIERERRERHSAIRREYLERSSVILAGEVKPNRVISVLSNKYNMSVMGIKTILKNAGIYKDAKHPVVLNGNNTPQQMSLNF